MLQTDVVTLVNEQDEVVGTMDKVEAHRGSGKLHRACSVFLFRKAADDEGLEVLVQQRSDKKIVGAYQWANTCCGNVWPQETYELCAKRRLAVELGITDLIQLDDVYTFRYQVRCNQEFSENEIDHIFLGWYDCEVLPNSDEVIKVRWLPWTDFLTQASANSDWAPWTKKMLQEPELIKIITAYVQKGDYARVFSGAR